MFVVYWGAFEILNKYLLTITDLFLLLLLPELIYYKCIDLTIGVYYKQPVYAFTVKI